MTDSEKELRRLAQLVKANTRDYLFFNDIETAAAVLALLDRIEALEKQVRPSHPTAEHSQRVVNALEEMLAPLSDGTLGTRDVVGRVSVLLEKNKALVEFAESFAGTAESAVAAHEAPKTGMQVPYHGDFAGAGPSIVGQLRWWAREARNALKRGAT